MKQRVLKTSAFVVAFAFIGFFGLQYYATQRISSLLETITQKTSEQGYTLSLGKREVFTSLFNIEIHLTNMKVESTQDWPTKGGINGKLLLKGTIFNPLNLKFETEGQVYTSWANPFGGEFITLKAEKIEGYVKLSTSGQLKQKKATMSKASLSIGEVLPLAKIETVEFLFSPVEDHKKVNLNLTTTKISLAPTLASPLGHTIDKIVFESTIEGQFKGHSFQEIMDRWYQDGGIFKLNKFQIIWNKLIVDANGAISVDQALQPLITLSSKIKGLNSTLDTLVKAKVIHRNGATVAKLALGGLSGGSDQLDLSITLQDGELSLGPITILQGLKIQWTEFNLKNAQAPPQVLSSQFESLG